MTILHDIDPVAVPLPFWPHGIHWYGLMYLAGFGFAWWLGRRRVRAGRLPGVNEEAFGDLIFYGMLGVVLGGRLGYVLFYGLEAALADPLSVLRINEGGMSFHGGLLGVLAAAAWWTRKHRLHAFDTIDFLAPLVPAGLGFGRLGNYIGGELWGKPTGGTWGVVFPDALPVEYARLPAEQLRQLHASGALDAFARHPSQLYQAFLEGAVMLAALLWFSRRPRPRYAVSGLFALLYGLFRFAIEFVREPDAHIGYLAFGWLTMGQVLSLPLLVVGLWLLWLSRRAPTLAPAPPAEEAR
ncbi:prolipoprotein diacylglyceryl transferase [Arenimonas fontis]|uniref:Phosphatidylglycerol--prolipoprotein diacylglyceryl transferase n=1 Tax=Arenimonas fontis TaxID=2608255 RepID=A0A5B2Z6V1_9GAMM|nr:prolipoprotein diacylglyceryl transferase [Arenimonas fontis]KAA2283689.1 prolipoprotein diacylglyceryl transferase [Arenimonas fontis]